MEVGYSVGFACYQLSQVLGRIQEVMTRNLWLEGTNTKLVEEVERVKTELEAANNSSQDAAINKVLQDKLENQFEEIESLKAEVIQQKIINEVIKDKKAAAENKDPKIKVEKGTEETNNNEVVNKNSEKSKSEQDLVDYVDQLEKKMLEYREDREDMEVQFEALKKDIEKKEMWENMKGKVERVEKQLENTKQKADLQVKELVSEVEELEVTVRALEETNLKLVGELEKVQVSCRRGANEVASLVGRNMVLEEDCRAMWGMVKEAEGAVRSGTREPRSRSRSGTRSREAGARSTDAGSWTREAGYRSRDHTGGRSRSRSRGVRSRLGW